MILRHPWRKKLENNHMEYVTIDKKIEVFKQKADYYDSVLEGLGKFRQITYGSKLGLLIWYSDFCFFITLSCYDLWIVISDYIKSIKVYQQNYYARQLSLIIFELLSDISQHFDEKYKQLFEIKIDDEILKKRAYAVRKIFNKYRNDNESNYKNIRDTTIAHRSHDIDLQINVINGMANDEIFQFSFDYLKSLEDLLSLLSDTVKYINKDWERMSKEEYFLKYQYEDSNIESPSPSLARAISDEEPGKTSS
jgi:hypothetical protein